MLRLNDRAMKWGREPNPICFLVLTGLLRVAHSIPVKANVSLLYFNTFNKTTERDRCECGVFGMHSPVADAHGLVVPPNSTSLRACTSDTEFAAAMSPWIALIARGNCTFTEKINRAAAQGAEAVVIYNYARRGNHSVPMAHPGLFFQPLISLLEQRCPHVATVQSYLREGLSQISLIHGDPTHNLPVAIIFDCSSDPLCVH